MTNSIGDTNKVASALKLGKTKATTWSTTWDTSGAKDMGEVSITSLLAIVSSDTNSIIGGFTQATLIADGTNTPTFDGTTPSNWVNTAGTRNRVMLQRVGDSKYWTVPATTGSAIYTGVSTLPQIATVPKITAGSLSSPLVWVAAGGVTGNPTPVVTYDILLADGTVVLLGTQSGAFQPTTAGNYVIRANATNAAGTVTALSTASWAAWPILALAAPVVTVAPVLTATYGAALTWVAATVTGNPTPTVTYSVLVGGSVVSATATSGSYVASAEGSYQVRANATNTQGSTTGLSNTVTVTRPVSAPAISAVPVIQSASYNSTVTWTSPGVVTGYPTPTVVYDILVGSTVVASNATSGSYTATTTGSLTVRETATNSQGSAVQTSTAVTITNSLTAPTVTTAPVLTVATYGATVTWTNASGIAGNPTPTVTYDILVAGTAIATNQTSGSYTLTQSGSVTVRANISNSQGSITSVSNAIVAAASSAPAIATAPVITVAQTGSPVTWTNASGITGNPTPTVVYNVLLGGSVVASNATSGSYTLVGSGSVTVQAVATNSISSATATSAAVTSTAAGALYVISAETGGTGVSSTLGYFNNTSSTATMRVDSNMQIELLGSGSPGALTLMFPSFCVSSTGYFAAVNSFQIDGCAIVYGGVNYPVTFSGQASQTLDSSAPYFYADPITIPGITLPAVIKVRTGMVIPISGKAPTSRGPISSTTEQGITNGASSQVAGTANMVANGGAVGAQMYGPTAILGVKQSGTAKAFLIQGDNLMTGTTTNDPDAYGNRGYVERTLRSAGYNCATLARDGTKAQWGTVSVVNGSTAAAGLYTLLPSVSVVITNSGCTDFSNGATLANMQAWKLNEWAGYKAANPSVKIIAIKVNQRTNASNAIYSTAFDPAGTNLVGQFNAWLDTQVTAGHIDYVYNPRPITESTTTPGTWANYSTDSKDGLNYSIATDSGSMQTDFSTWLAANVT